MGTLKIFTIRDSKAEAYLTPFMLKSKGEALRAFTELSNDPQHQFCKYAADFTLFEIGEYYEDNGTIVTYDSKINLGMAHEFKKSNQITQITDLKQIPETLNQQLPL